MPSLEAPHPPADDRLLEVVRQAVVVTDPGGKVTYWNPYAEHLFGWSADEMLGRHILEVTPLDRAARRDLLTQLGAGGSWTGEFLVRRKGGEPVPTVVTVSVAPGEDGRPAGVVGLSREAIQTDRELHYDALFRHASEGFAVYEALRDEDGRLVDTRLREANPAIREMLGSRLQAPGAVLGDRSGWLAKGTRVLRTGDPEDVEISDPDTGRWHVIHLSRVTRDRLALFCFDVTARKEAERREAELFDELNHRVRNSLTFVAGFLGLQARSAPPTVRTQLLKAVDRVHSIAEVHRSLYRDHAYRREVVDLGAYLRALCTRLAGSLPEDGRVAIQTDFPGDAAAAVPADVAIALGMIANELVCNAAQHAFPHPAQGVIFVALHRTDDTLTMIVQDSGVGLSEDMERDSGTLGMHLVRSLVAQIGGYLDVRHGAGVTFYIILPDAPEPGRP